MDNSRYKKNSENLRKGSINKNSEQKDKNDNFLGNKIKNSYHNDIFEYTGMNIF